MGHRKPVAERMPTDAFLLLFYSPSVLVPLSFGFCKPLYIPENWRGLMLPYFSQLWSPTPVLTKHPSGQFLLLQVCTSVANGTKYKAATFFCVTPSHVFGYLAAESWYLGISQYGSAIALPPWPMWTFRAFGLLWWIVWRQRIVLVRMNPNKWNKWCV